MLKDAAREVYRRLMDAVDTAEQTLRDTTGVLHVGTVRLRWIGHQLRAECEIGVDATLNVSQAHAIAAEHRLIHAIPRLTAAIVHADPIGEDIDQHAGLDHHITARADRPIRQQQPQASLPVAAPTRAGLAGCSVAIRRDVHQPRARRRPRWTPHGDGLPVGGTPRSTTNICMPRAGKFERPVRLTPKTPLGHLRLTVHLHQL